MLVQNAFFLSASFLTTFPKPKQRIPKKKKEKETQKGVEHGEKSKARERERVMNLDGFNGGLVQAVEVFLNFKLLARRTHPSPQTQ